MKFALVALIISIPMFVGASEKAITVDAENYVAIGYSENPSAQLAKQDACNAARRELIGHVFGAAYQINQNMVRSLGAVDYLQDVSVNTGEIIIRGAITESSTENDVAKCSISYPKAEAILENERLKSANGFKNTQFTDFGDANEIRGGVLEVVTIPDDADVYIDNQRWGMTPTRFNSKLTIGPHVIRLEKANYKVIEMTKEIGASTKTRIEEILKRATGKLRIVTEPEGATVAIDGQVIGQSPTSEIEILSGHKAKIEVSHPEADSIIQIVSLERDQERTLPIRLQLKPSAFSIHIVPESASVILDGGPAIAIDKWTSTTAGPHTLTITNEGYEDETLSFQLRGGEKKSLSSVTLRSISKEKERHLKNGPGWSVGLYLGLAQSTLSGVDTVVNQVGLQARYQIFRLLSTELVGSYGFGSAKYSDGTLNTTGYQAKFGFPIHLYRSSSAAVFTSRVSLAPEIAWANHSYSAKYKATGQSSASVEYAQVGYGGELIYSIFSKTDYKETGYFLDLRFGFIKYDDSSPLQGAAPASTGVTAGATW